MIFSRHIGNSIAKIAMLFTAKVFCLLSLFRAYRSIFNDAIFVTQAKAAYYINIVGRFHI